MEPKHRYEDLTWPQVNEAVEAGLIPVLPVGTLEQHGPHLPVKMDKWTADAVADESARRRPDRLLAMPVVAYGYTTHVMDYPGSITVHHETFTRYVVDVLRPEFYNKLVFVVADLGTRDGQAFSSRYRVGETTLVFFNSTGGRIGTMRGVQTEESLRIYIESLYRSPGRATVGGTQPPKLRGIVDEYNRKAKDIIDTMGR